MGVKKLCVQKRIVHLQLATSFGLEDAGTAKGCAGVTGMLVARVKTAGQRQCPWRLVGSGKRVACAVEEMREGAWGRTVVVCSEAESGKAHLAARHKVSGSLGFVRSFLM